MRVVAVRLSDTGSRWLTFDTPVPVKAIGSIIKRKPRRVRRDPIEAMHEARRAQAVVPHSDRPAIAREYLETNITYQEIADRYGVHDEWIRQIVVEHDPLIPAKRRARQIQEQADREAAGEWVTLWKRCRLALAEDRRCKACGGWVLRGRKSITCSSECAEAYVTLRTFDDPDYHRRSIAKVYLARPGQYADVRVEWAKRMLGPNPPERNRTFLVPGSERAEIIRKYRPDEYAALVESS